MAMAFDAASVKPLVVDSATNPATITHTPSGTPTFAVVAVCSGWNGVPASDDGLFNKATTVTYGGTGMTLAVDQEGTNVGTADYLYGALYWLASPPIGAQTVSVTSNHSGVGSGLRVFGVTTFTGGGVVATTASDADRTATSSDDITIGTVNDAVISEAFISMSIGPVVPDAQSIRWSAFVNRIRGGTKSGATPSVDVGWSWGSGTQNWVHVVMSIPEAAGGLAGGGNPVVDGTLPGTIGGQNLGSFTSPFFTMPEIDPYPFFKSGLELHTKLTKVRVI